MGLSFLGKQVGCHAGMWICGPLCAKLGKWMGGSVGSGLSRPAGTVSLWLYDNVLGIFVETIVHWIDSDGGLGRRFLALEAKDILDEIVRKASRLASDTRYLR